MVRGCVAWKENQGKTPWASPTTPSDEHCYAPGRVWCHRLQRKMNQCQSLSLGCYFKIMCHNPCVCETWKHVNCGSKISGDPKECPEHPDYKKKEATDVS